jgi:hypothetical protein
MPFPKDGSGGGAPTDVAYLVGAADPDLPNAIVAGAAPGGQLGGTWSAPTVSTNHATLGGHHSQFYEISPAAGTWLNLGAGPSELSVGGAIARAVVNDLSLWTDLRMICSVTPAGVTGDAKLQYSTDDAAWTDLVSTLIDLSTTGIKATAWEAIPAGAQAGIIAIRIVGVNGNGTEDPGVRGVVLQVR